MISLHVYYKKRSRVERKSGTTASSYNHSYGDKIHKYNRAWNIPRRIPCNKKKRINGWGSSPTDTRTFELSGYRDPRGNRPERFYTRYDKSEDHEDSGRCYLQPPLTTGSYRADYD